MRGGSPSLGASASGTSHLPSISRTPYHVLTERQEPRRCEGAVMDPVDKPASSSGSGLAEWMDCQGNTHPSCLPACHIWAIHPPNLPSLPGLAAGCSSPAPAPPTTPKHPASAGQEPLGKNTPKLFPPMEMSGHCLKLPWRGSRRSSSGHLHAHARTHTHTHTIVWSGMVHLLCQENLISRLNPIRALAV